MKLGELLEHVGDCQIYVLMVDERAKPKFHGFKRFNFTNGEDAKRCASKCSALVHEFRAALNATGAPSLFILAEFLDPADQPKSGAN